MHTADGTSDAIVEAKMIGDVDKEEEQAEDDEEEDDEEMLSDIEDDMAPTETSTSATNNSFGTPSMPGYAKTTGHSSAATTGTTNCRAGTEVGLGASKADGGGTARSAAAAPSRDMADVVDGMENSPVVVAFC